MTDVREVVGVITEEREGNGMGDSWSDGVRLKH